MTEQHDIDDGSMVLIGLLAAALSGALVGVVAGSIGTIIFIMWGM